MLLAILALEARLETKRNMVAEKEEDEEAKGEITVVGYVQRISAQKMIEMVQLGQLV